MELIFATNNQHKVEEMQAAAGKIVRFKSLKDAGIDIDIPEPHDTIAANASEKSKTIYQLTGQNCFSEDTGLEVDVLGGAPGVKSARYAAGDQQFNGDNVGKLLHTLGDRPDRTARFRTVISLIIEGKEYLFEGICEGRIGYTKAGGLGFGYDPVFLPAGSNRTFAEMALEEKALYSHRQKAADKLVAFLQKADYQANTEQN